MIKLFKKVGAISLIMAMLVSMMVVSASAATAITKVTFKINDIDTGKGITDVYLNSATKDTYTYAKLAKKGKALTFLKAEGVDLVAAVKDAGLSDDFYNEFWNANLYLHSETESFTSQFALPICGNVKSATNVYGEKNTDGVTMPTPGAALNTNPVKPIIAVKSSAEQATYAEATAASATNDCMMFCIGQAEQDAVDDTSVLTSPFVNGKYFTTGLSDILLYITAKEITLNGSSNYKATTDVKTPVELKPVVTINDSGRDFTEYFDITWESDNEKVATVDENGKVTPVGVGTCKITCSVEGMTAPNITDTKTTEASITVTEKSNVNTGDTTDMMLYVIMSAIAILGVACVSIKKSR